MCFPHGTRLRPVSTVKQRVIDLVAGLPDDATLTQIAQQLRDLGDLPPHERDAQLEQARVLRALGQRVRELTVLHETARLLQNDNLSLLELLGRIAELLPPAFQFPDITAARLTYGNVAVATAGYEPTPCRLATSFQSSDGQAGAIEVVCLQPCPNDAEAFLPEERHLLASLGDLLLGHINHRLVEASWRRSEERLHLALSAAQLGIWEWDFKTGIVTWDARMEQIAGLEPGTFGGSIAALEQALHPDDVAVMRAAIDATLFEPERADRHGVECRFLLPGRGATWITSKGKLFRDTEGQPARMLGMAMDISERHALEAQFLQAQKMEAVGRLAGGIAHDFNNLLTVIGGNCHLLPDHGRLDEVGHELLAEIRDAAERGASLTRQLLTFSRKSVVQVRAVDLDGLVRQTQNLLCRLLGEDIDLSTRLAAAGGCVRADPSQLEQILMNLVVNARDAMPQGGALRLETQAVQLDAERARQFADARPGPYLMLEVADDGSGMDATTLGRIFEPFFTTKEPGKGTGLGLAVVFGVVKQCEGFITVESQAGIGTTFRLYLPRMQVVADTSPASHYPELPRGSETVLVVEDEASLRRFICLVLQTQGYRVLDAASGVEALTIADQYEGAIHLLLTDLVMPGLQGRQLVEALRAKRPDIKVLLVSGYTDDVLLGHGIVDAQHELLQKPFSPSMLARTVRSVLDA
jgi:two-component system, cell cycle sensor histidine kinase and response regulator CckA